MQKTVMLTLSISITVLVLFPVVAHGLKTMTTKMGHQQLRYTIIVAAAFHTILVS